MGSCCVGLCWRPNGGAMTRLSVREMVESTNWSWRGQLLCDGALVHG